MARPVAEFVATLCCATFFGAAAYISLVQHPAALETGNEFAVRFFAPMYRRASIMQASLAIAGAGSALAAYLLNGGRAWLLAALLIVGVVPFTLLVVEPVNQQLKAIDPADDLAVQLLTRWGRLHVVRTVTSGLSFAFCLVAVAQRTNKFLA